MDKSALGTAEPAPQLAADTGKIEAELGFRVLREVPSFGIGRKSSAWNVLARAFLGKAPGRSTTAEAVVNKRLTIKSGLTHAQRSSRPLLEKIESGQIDPSFVLTHRLPLKKCRRVP
jgi:hypothetical protein